MCEITKSIREYRPDISTGKDIISNDELLVHMRENWTFSEMSDYFQKIKWNSDLLSIAYKSLHFRLQFHEWESDDVVADFNALHQMLGFHEGRILLTVETITMLFQNEKLPTEFERCMVLLNHVLTSSVIKFENIENLHKVAVNWIQRQWILPDGEFHPCTKRYEQIITALYWWNNVYTSDFDVVHNLGNTCNWLLKASLISLLKGPDSDVLCMLRCLDAELRFNEHDSPIHSTVVKKFSYAVMNSFNKSHDNNVILALFPPCELEHSTFSTHDRESLNNPILLEWERRLGYVNWNKKQQQQTVVNNDTRRQTISIDNSNTYMNEDIQNFNPNTRCYMTFKQQYKESNWMKSMRAYIMHKLMNKWIKRKRLSLKTQPLISDLLHNRQLLWPTFAVWYSSFSKFCKTYVSRKVYGQLSLWMNIYNKSLLNFTQSVDNETITIETVNFIVSSYYSAFAATLSINGQKSYIDTCIKLNRLIQKSYNLFVRMKSTLDIYDDSDSAENAKTIQYALKNWNQLKLYELYHFLNKPTKNSKGIEIEHDVILPELSKSVDWLLYLKKSKMFSQIWNKYNYESSFSEHLLKVCHMWSKLYKTLCNGKITFATMEIFSKFLINEKEIKWLFNTASCSNFTIDQQHWVIAKTNYCVVKSTVNAVKRWYHLKKVYDNYDCITRTLQNLHLIVESSGHQSLQIMEDQVLYLRNLFDKERDWNTQTLNDSVEYEKISQCIPSVLFTVNPQFYIDIKNSNHLIDWLKTMPDDNIEFSNIIEMAIGKSEMECPFELWKTVPGKPGCPDEEKLSMLNTVRSFLHSYIYRTKDFADFSDILDRFLLKLGKYDETILNALQVCNQYLQQLRQLLSDEYTGTLSLMYLQNPTFQTQWVISNQPKDLNTDYDNWMWLEWVVPNSTGTLYKKQNMNQLLDFQSTIVLSHIEYNSAEIQECVDRFIQQLGWANELYNIVRVLYHATHFDYQNFSYRFPFDCDPQVMKSTLISLQHVHQKWELTIHEMLKRHYFLNFYNMKQIQRFVQIMDGQLIEEPIKSRAFLRDMLALVNPVEKDVDTFIEKLKTNWMFNHTGVARSGVNILDVCGNCLFEALTNVKPPIRKIMDNRDASEYISTSINKKDVYVVCAETPAAVFSHAALIYIKLGYLPERQEVLLCREDTTLEDVYRFLQRWAGSHLHNRSKRVYTMISLENLNYEIQYATTKYIRDLLPDVENSLVLISASETQYLVTQVSYHRIVQHFPPYNLLKVLGHALNNEPTSKVTCYRSKFSGSGKSFTIRRMAVKQQYIHFPIYSTIGLLERLLKLRTNILNIEQPTIIHFDLFDTIHENFNSYMFELCFLGGITHSLFADSFMWNQQNISLAVEISSGNLIERLPVIHLLKSVPIESSSKTFCSQPKILDDCFEVKWKTKVSRRLSQSDNFMKTAYYRLQYVCSALKIMINEKGQFPYNFEGPTKHLDGATCFNLLVEASDLNRKHPSLWCIWNFVNVLYRQLYDIHCKNSPINNACIPDPTSEQPDHELSKRYFKGEIIKFSISTAREFATRQTKMLTHDQIIGLRISGFTRYQWNGTWHRMPYNNDDKPCFKHNLFYLYYRQTENRWVIDDIITPYGPTFSNNSNENIMSQWITSPTWVTNSDVKVNVTKDPRGFNGEAIDITGMNETENGRYLRQPVYDDIENHPHYLKNDDDGNGIGNRRHLIWNKSESCWQISPVCNSTGGVFALSTSETITRSWRTMPQDIIETRAELTYLRGVPKWIDYSIPNPESSIPEHENNSTTELTNDEKAIMSDLSHLQTLFDNTLGWNDSNHEIMLFSNKTHSLNFLSLDAKKLRHRMHPNLLSFLQINNFDVGQNINSLSSSIQYEILSNLTNVVHTKEDALQLMNGEYCLTGDSLMKLLAVYVRIICGIPVILMGECGCGKTMLINYMCAWLGVDLLTLDCHGGTHESDILQILNQAEAKFDDTTRTTKHVYVFMDEINTCGHMGLVTEIICQHSVYGRKLRPEIVVLAAINPYRQKPIVDVDNNYESGLLFQTANTRKLDPMSHLVYRVHPIPNSLRDFVFDFGSLDKTKETMYIESMTNRNLKTIFDVMYTNDDDNQSIKIATTHIIRSIVAAQDYVRLVEKDSSAVSLRDAKRCLHLINWFWNNLSMPSEPNVSEKLRNETLFIRSIILGLAFVYHYRLNNDTTRSTLWEHIFSQSKNNWTKWGTSSNKSPWCINNDSNDLQRKVVKLESEFCENVELDDSIAMNTALRENVFITIVSILNRIPIFLIGKPGTSKTLTMQVIASNLQGIQSRRVFWRKYPAVHIFPYQCSPMSDSHGIQHQFEMAVRYQKHAGNSIAVLLLDEVGLAEHSPDMPLKVLHGMLINPPISIVGLSNWLLDPAKMNRALCIQRPDPFIDDIKETALSIMNLNTLSGALWTSHMESLARVFHTIYHNQPGREFFGMRDYYSLIKLLRTEYPKRIEP